MFQIAFFICNSNILIDLLSFFQQKIPSYFLQGTLSKGELQKIIKYILKNSEKLIKINCEILDPDIESKIIKRIFKNNQFHMH